MLVMAINEASEKDKLKEKEAAKARAAAKAKAMSNNSAAKSISAAAKSISTSIGANSQSAPGTWGTTTTSTQMSKTPSILEAERWDRVIIALDSVRGKAVVSLARKLTTMRWGSDYLSCVEIAQDLLQNESREVCEAVSTLLEDNWEGGVGDLLACARNL